MELKKDALTLSSKIKAIKNLSFKRKKEKTLSLSFHLFSLFIYFLAFSFVIYIICI